MASLVFALFFLVAVTHAQNVPSKVKEAFTKKFPNAQQVEWGKENPTVFEAEFVLNGTHMSANFDQEGNWKETEVEISHSDLPAAVQQTLKSDYAAAKVKHIFKVTSPDQTVYEVAVAKASKEKMDEEDEGQEENEHGGNEQGEYGEGKNIQELVFTADGKLVKKEGAEEKD